MIQCSNLEKEIRVECNEELGAGGRAGGGKVHVIALKIHPCTVFARKRA